MDSPEKIRRALVPMTRMVHELRASVLFLNAKVDALQIRVSELSPPSDEFLSHIEKIEEHLKQRITKMDESIETLISAMENLTDG